MIRGTLLASLLSACAPTVSPDTMHAVVMVESSADPLSIGDNTTHTSYRPSSYRAAIATARALAAQGHSLDLGIAQVNSAHLTPSVTIADLLDPCRNLRVAAAILADDYAQARHVFPDPQRALRAALGAYNTGSIYDGAAYVARVLAAAGIPSVGTLNDRPRSWRPVLRRRITAHRKTASTTAPAVWRGAWERP